jgi:hypothetical protein
MDRFARDDLRELLEKSAAPCVSVYMPTTRGVGNADKTRWKNLVWEAETCLHALRQPPAEAQALMAPARELLDNVPFWLNVSEGLAGYFSPAVTHLYRLPFPFPEKLVVAERFHVSPLIPLFMDEGRFFILALSEKLIRLLQATRFTVQELELHNVPTSQEDALQSDVEDARQTVHTHTAPGGSALHREAISHGHGTGIDSAKYGLVEYFQKVNRGLHRYLHEESAPLVLAGVDYLLPAYREANTYPHLLEEAMLGNVDRLSARELHDQAWEIVQPHFRERQAKVAALYHQLVGTGRTARDLEQVVRAAVQGQVQFLFVPRGEERWGRFDPLTQVVDLHDRRQPGDDELLDLAVSHTLLHRGMVYSIQREDGPDSAPLAAVFWLPLGERSGNRVIA